MQFFQRASRTLTLSSSSPILKIIVPKPRETLKVIHSPLLSQALCIIDPARLLVIRSKNIIVKL